MTTDEAKALLADVVRAARRAAAALAARDAAIVAAATGGQSHRQIAIAAGLSHPSISKIVARYFDDTEREEWELAHGIDED